MTDRIWDLVQEYGAACFHNGHCVALKGLGRATPDEVDYSLARRLDAVTELNQEIDRLLVIRAAADTNVF